MGSPVVVSSRSDVADFMSRNLVRNYPANVTPSSMYNTFPVGYTNTLASPGWQFISKGTAVESGHSCTFAFERAFPSGQFPSYDSASNPLFLTKSVEVRATMYGLTITPANVTTNDAFQALTIFDPGTSVANYLTGSRFAQVRQSLTSRTTWSLHVYDGGGNTYSTTFPTVPDVGGGHVIRARFDCTKESIEATIDGSYSASMSVAQSSFPAGSFDGSGIGGTNLIGFTLFAGTTQSAATQSQMTISALSTITYEVA